MRNTMAASVARSRLASAMACWNSTAAPSAPRALGELYERSVACQLNQSPTMAGERRFEAFSHMPLEPDERAVFITAHQARIADHIRCQDSCQSSSYSLTGQKKPPARLSLPRYRPASRLVCI